MSTRAECRALHEGQRRGRAVGRKAEREAVVKWLRGCAAVQASSRARWVLEDAAAAIEKGQHRR